MKKIAFLLLSFASLLNGHPVSRMDEPWYAVRHKEILERRTCGPVDMVFIGDSITHWWESHGKAVWQSYYGSRNVLNLGYRGDQTQHVLWRLANGEIDDIAPKLAVIMIGTNNRNSTVDELAEGIEAVCNTVLTKLPETKVLLLAIFPRDDLGPVYRTKIGQVNERIALLADNKRLFYMDIGYLFLDSSGNVRKDLFYDLLHPGAAGYQIWAESIEPFLVKSAL